SGARGAPQGQAPAASHSPSPVDNLETGSHRQRCLTPTAPGRTLPGAADLPPAVLDGARGATLGGHE
ncbi:MAG: hypothetical protein M3442_19380, partial [Chloroflexota bacterium]|nr:hypothetical protein [Chloroflexota bacterium]